MEPHRYDSPVVRDKWLGADQLGVTIKLLL